MASPGDRFDSTRVGPDHVSLDVETIADLYAAAGQRTALGVEYDEVLAVAEAAGPVTRSTSQGTSVTR